MFLSNWLVLQIVAAGVTGAVEYPSAADFFMNFDSNNSLYFTGGSNGYVSNLILYKGETEYPVYNGSVSNIYISDPETYVSYIQLCNETYVTNTVDVQAVVNPEGTFPDTATNIIPGYATPPDPGQGSMGSYIDFSGDGTRMVVGMGLYNTNQGRAAVYHLEDGRWVQKVDLAPTSTSTRFGDSVLMNEDGTRIAVNYYPDSTIKIYEYTNGAWPTSPTTSISTTTANGDMDWNNDGTVLVTGEGEGGSKAYIYTRDSGTGNWSLTKTWSGITNLGNGVAMNGAGTRVLIGQRNASGSHPNYIGKVYEANYDSGTSTWSSLTEVYASAADTVNWPTRIRMDNDGTTAVVLSGTDGQGRILERQSGTSWTKTFDVSGRCSFYSRGSGTISYDGTMVLTGNSGYTDSVSGQGRAFLYEYTNGTWSLTKTFENPKTTPVASDYWGGGTTITKLKDRIAIGMMGDDTAGTNYGSLYVYDLEYSYPTLTQDEYNKLTLNSLTDVQRSRLTLNSNTYTANGPVSKFFVNEAGTYEVSASGSDAYAIVKKTVSAPITLTEADIAWNDYTQADTTEQKIQASDKEAQDYFGYSVSISGDYAIVGARLEDTGATDAGAAYIYTRNASTGVWGNEQKIQASDKQQSDNFGYSVSLSGDYAIVGAPFQDADTGAVYIYKRDASTGTWGSEQKLTASDKQVSDQFGRSVSIDGDYAIVGARFEDTGAASVGAVYIYTRSGTTWGNEQKIQASDKQQNDQFGTSVSISGDYAIVASELYASGVDSGAAYIFKRSGTSWIFQDKLTTPESNRTNSGQFGTVVSISGDYAIVGTPSKFSYMGAAYIYTRDASTGVWGSEQKIQASDSQDADRFGQSVSLSGDYAIVGAWGEDTGGADGGAAYIFKRDGTTWSEIKKIQASDKASNDYFGESVSIDGNYAIVGAYLEDPGGTGNAGAAYIYKAPDIPSPKLTYDTYNKLTLSNVSTSYSSTLRYESNTYDIGTASTIIIQDPGRYEIATTDNENFLSLNSNVTDTSVTQVGVYDYTQVDTTEQKITASDAADGDRFGVSVSISGDYAFVGARNGEDTASNSGSVYVFLRNRTTGEWFYQQELTASDATTADFFCVSISIDGDYAIIGAHSKNSSKGAAYIFKRIGTTWTEQDTFTANDVAAGDGFGWSVGLSGDYAIAGARGNDGSGSVYIFKRDTNAETWTQHQKLKANDTASGDEFGNSVAIEGDYIIVGAHFSEHNDIANNPGNAYIFKRDGTTDTWSEYQRLTASDAATQNQFGSSVSISGDYAIIGAANGDSSTVTDSGSAYIFKKTTTTLSGVRNPYFTDASTIVTDSNWSSSTGFEITSSQDSSTTFSQNWRAFDNTYTAINPWESTWLSGNSPLTMPAWIQIQYPQDVVIQSYTIVGRDDTDRYYPTSWQLQGATAAAPSTYVNLETNGGNRTASSWAPLAKVSYDVNTPGTAYRYFRLYVNSSNESGQVSINELKLYTTPLSGQSVTVEESWSEQQKLTASDAAIGTYFGFSVSISGDYAIVGAYGTSVGGTAYIFKRDGTTWSEIKNLTGSDIVSGDQFATVAIDGGVIFVGAKVKNSLRGAAYIYTADNLASTLSYDGLNTLVLSNVSTGSYNTFLEGSNVLACATDLTTYPVPKSGITGTFTYSARTKSDSVYAFTNDVSITDYYKTYQYPPIDGTTTGLTSSSTSATWTISGVQYSTESSVAGSPYNTFDNSITSGFDSTSSTGDIIITFESAKTIRKYIVWPYDSTAPVSTPGGSTDPTLSTDGTFRPKSWTVYGTNNTNDWSTVLDTVTNQPPSIYGDVHSISSPASYQYYKLSVTANNGGSGLKIGEWQLWGDA